MKWYLFILTIFVVGLPLHGMHIHHTPEQFEKARSIGAAASLMHMLFNMDQLVLERNIVKARALQAKEHAALVAANTDDAAPTPKQVAQAVDALKPDPEKKKNDEAVTDPRQAQIDASYRQLKGAQLFSGVIGALEEGVAVRNNVVERALGIVTNLVPVGVQHKEQIGRRIFLRTLLTLLEGFLGVARHGAYKNAQRMMWITAAHRSARLLHTMLAHGVRNLNIRVIGAYALQLLSIGASFFGDPRENSLHHFDWRGRIRNVDQKKVIGNYQEYFVDALTKKALSDPTVSLDRREKMKKELQELHDKMLPFEQSKARLHAYVRFLSDNDMALFDQASGQQIDTGLMMEELLKDIEKKQSAALLYLRPPVPEVYKKLSSFDDLAREAIAADRGCVICLDKIADPATLDCKSHAYCYECITEHLNTAEHRTCPQCRAEVTQITRAGAPKELSFQDKIKAQSLLSKDRTQRPTNTKTTLHVKIPRANIVIDSTTRQADLQEQFDELLF